MYIWQITVREECVLSGLIFMLWLISVGEAECTFRSYTCICIWLINVVEAKVYFQAYTVELQWLEHHWVHEN